MASKFRQPQRVTRMRPFGGPSVWLEFSPLAQLTGAINLGQGVPGWAPPDFFTRSLQKAVSDTRFSQYAPSTGVPELTREISRVYSPRIVPKPLRGKRTLDPRTEVLVTVGASQALFLACSAFLDIGDEAVLIAPAFDMYYGAVQLNGAKAVYVPLRPKNGAPKSSAELTLDVDEFAKCVSNKTKVVILNSPHNPTGKVFSQEEYLQIASVLDEKAPACVVLSDEVYERLVFEGEHVPFASVSVSAFDRTLSVYSAGKTFSATGSKTGWVVGPAHLLRDLRIAHQFTVFATNHTAQIAVADALREAEVPYNGHDSFYDWNCEEYKRKRDLLVEILREGGMNPIVPQGAFYICTQVPEAHPSREHPGLPAAISGLVEDGKLEIDPGTADRSDYNVCRNLVLRYGVAAIPTSAFFSEEDIERVELAESYVRFAFCKPDEELAAARNKICGEPRPLSRKATLKE